MCMHVSYKKKITICKDYFDIIGILCDLFVEK